MAALANQSVSISMPLYQWLMLLGALGNLPDSSWYERLADQVMDVVKP